MDRPHQRSGKRQVGVERPSGDQQQQQRARRVERDVDDVVAAHVEAVERVVDGEREAGKRPPRDRCLPRRDEHLAHVRQILDLRILDDGRLVVENERAVEAVGVGQRNGKSEKERAHPGADTIQTVARSPKPDGRSPKL